MTTGGWINMVLSVGFVSVLFLYCVFRVLFGAPPKGELGHVEPLDEDEVNRE